MDILLLRGMRFPFSDALRNDGEPRPARIIVVQLFHLKTIYQITTNETSDLATLLDR